jgi:hypothetical protein
MENKMKKLQGFQSVPATITAANMIADSVLVLKVCQLNAIY